MWCSISCLSRFSGSALREVLLGILRGYGKTKMPAQPSESQNKKRSVFKPIAFIILTLRYSMVTLLRLRLMRQT